MANDDPEKYFHDMQSLETKEKVEQVEKKQIFQFVDLVENRVRSRSVSVLAICLSVIGALMILIYILTQPSPPNNLMTVEIGVASTYYTG